MEIKFEKTKTRTDIEIEIRTERPAEYDLRVEIPFNKNIVLLKGRLECFLNPQFFKISQLRCRDTDVVTGKLVYTFDIMCLDDRVTNFEGLKKIFREESKKLGLTAKILHL